MTRWRMHLAAARSTVCLVALLLLAPGGGCGKKAASGGKITNTASPPADPALQPRPRSMPSTPPRPVHPFHSQRCKDLKMKFRAVLDTATGTCKTDADCAVYPIFVNCGSVTDKPTAEKLRVVRKQAWKAECGWGLACAARLRAVPRCKGGACYGDRSGHNRRFRRPRPKTRQPL